LLVVPEHKVTRARFRFVDVHNHQRATARERLEQVVKAMDEINMGVMVNLSGGYGDNLAKNVQAMESVAPGRFVVFANLNFTGIDDSDYGKRAAAQLEQDIRNGARGLKFFKGFGMDLKDTKGQRIHVDDPRFDPVFEVCARHKIPVLIHTGEPYGLFQPMDKNNERWLELKLYPRRGRSVEKGDPKWEDLMAEQHRLFARHPKTTFINAHLGWLGHNLDELGKLLDRLPNVHTEFSAVIEELGRQPRNAQRWLTKYQDRVMSGKDTWRPVEYGTYFRVLETADEYFDHDRKYHGIWKVYGLDLPSDVLRKIYYRNALRVIPGLNPKLFP
jgi:predicted TIM-barrel fold metal-dependent hydrolase